MEPEGIVLVVFQPRIFGYSLPDLGLSEFVVKPGMLATCPGAQNQGVSTMHFIGRSWMFAKMHSLMTGLCSL